MDQPRPGLIASWQFVQYNVREVLKGEVPDGKLRVRFILVRNSLTADEGRLRLSPELFRGKNVHILFLERDSEQWATDKKQLPWLTWLSYESVSQDYGAVMSTPAVMEKVRALPAASPGTLKAVGRVKGAQEN